MKAFLLLCLLPTLYSAHAQQESFFLPKRGKCGQLKEQQLYNLATTTEADEFPWLGRLKFATAKSPAEQKFIGLAVLISRRHLLTNARYFQNDLQDYESIAVALGVWNAADDYDVEEVVVHPDFGKQTEEGLFLNDIAVLRLRTDVAFSAYVQPICLPSSLALSNHVARYLPYVGLTLGGRDDSKEQKLLARVINSQSCGRLKRAKITDGLMCAVSSDPTSPLVQGSALMDVAVEEGVPHHYYLIGLLSESGVDGMGPSKPDVFVRVAMFIDWINYNIY